MNGENRSAFLLTEPDIASSDAKNVQLHMRKEGNEWVLNGSVSNSSPETILCTRFPLSPASGGYTTLTIPLIIAEMVEQWRGRLALQDICCRGQEQSKQQRRIQAKVRPSRPSRHLRHHLETHAVYLRI